MRNAAILAGMALALGIATLLPVSGQAQTPAGNPLVTGQVIRDYARITFYWPEKIDMTATTDGTKLVVRFDRPVNPNFGEILGKLYPYVKKAELTSDRRTIIFTMQKAFHIRSFITDSESGVDILDIHSDPAPVKSKPEAKPQPARPVVMPPPPREKPPVPVTATEAPVPQPAPAPAPEPQPAPEPKPEPAPPATPPVVEEQPAAPQPALAAETPTVETPAETPVEAPVDTPATAPAETPVPPAKPAIDIEAVKIAPMQDFGKISGEKMAVESSMEDKLPVLRFPFKERVAAAVWKRGRTVMVLFTKPVSLANLPDTLKTNRAWLEHAEQLGGAQFTLLRLDLVTDTYLQAQKDREGYGWQLHISSSRVQPQETITPAINRNQGEASVFLPATQMEKNISLLDPQVGDALVVVPLYASDTGVYPARSFVDFALLASQQGIVLAPKSDAVAVTQQENGVNISAKGGLFITENINQGAAEIAGQRENRDELFKPSLFPAREWQMASIDEYHEREVQLLQDIAAAKTTREKNAPRLELAHLYFMQDLYNEALGVLSTIRRDDLDFFRDKKLAGLEGASYLMRYRLPEAALSFSSDTLDNMPEGDLLRKAAEASMNPAAPPVPYMQNNAAYIRQYPAQLRQRLAIIAANHAIQQKDFHSPADIFESLEEDKLSGEVADYIDYLKAKLAAAAGRADEAERIWSRLAGKIEDRQFRARSEYSLVLLGLEEGTLSPEDAIKRLEALRIVWRGDDLERSLLSVLGQLQVNHGNYWEGMKAWEELLQNYPNTPDALAAYQRLAETFRSLFLDDAADKMDPVKALALYSEFQELTPLGADGNRMIQKLVDRLVSIDLLDPAAARLEHQVKYRLKGEDKSRVGARLALIYLLDREPEQALTALQNTREENVPASLSLERNRIAAQALIDLKRPEQALTMIEGDYSADGENVRLEAYWAQEDWAYVIDIIELMLRKRTDLNAPFSPQEGQRLLQLALAYIFQGEFDQMQYLREAYAPLMKGNPYEQEFLFLTQERIPANNKNFDKVISTIGAMQSFMDTYREKLKSGGLSETVGNKGNDDAKAAAPANPQ